MDATPQQKQGTSSLEAPSPRWQRKPGPVGSKSLHPCSLTAPLEPRFLTCQVGVMTAEPPAGGDPQMTVELPGGHCLAGEAVGRSLGENQGGVSPGHCSCQVRGLCVVPRTFPGIWGWYGRL